MDLRQVQYFVALYEEESVTKAARRLHVVQPAVSMQIRRLEADYGVALFDRIPQGVRPNAVARRLYPQCLDILEKVDLVRNRLRELAGRLAGRLTVGVPPSIAEGILPDVLVEFQKQNPEIQLIVREGYTANLVDWLVQGDLDFAVLTVLEDERRLRYQELATEELHLVTSMETSIGGSQIKGSDLVSLKLVLPSSRNLMRMLIETEFEQAGLPLSPAMEVDSLSAVFGIIRRAGWASILPASALRSGQRQRHFQSLRLVDPIIRRLLVVAFQPQREATPAAQLLIGNLETALKGRIGAPEELVHGLRSGVD